MVAAAAASRPSRLARNGAVAAVVTAATVATTQAQGAYGVGVWGPLGLGLVAAAVLLLAAGLRPARHVVHAGVALTALAAWTACSGLWGGVASEAQNGFDRSLIAAAALLCGSLLGRDRRHATAAAAGVAAGITAVAVEVLVVLPFAPRHGGWLVSGILVGPVGYKNAAGGLFAVATLLVLSFAPAARRTVRVLASASAVVLVSALLLTESRGALAALGAAVVVQSLIDRRPALRVAVAGQCLAAAVLFGTLSRLYGDLTDPPAARRALVAYALLTAGLAAAAGATASLRGPIGSRAGRLVLDVAVAAGVAIAVLAVAGRFSADPGGTGAAAPRLTDLSSRGRVDAWRAAWTMARSAPLAGHGAGAFARQWPTLKPPTSGHILQPHNLELEALAELGGVGLALVLLSFVLLLRCPDTRRDRPLAAAATGAVLLLIVQASVDWTWSFPGLVAPVLLVAGAAAGGTAQRAAPRLRAEILVSAAALAALVCLGAPYLAHRSVATAAAAVPSDPAEAYAAARSATRLNPWSPRAYDLKAQALEAAGDYAGATGAYATAARYALEPWVEHLNEARAADIAHRRGLAFAACRSALLENPYAVDEVRALCPRPSGRAWALTTLPAGAANGHYARRVVSQGCGSCTVAVHGGTVLAQVPGGFPYLDSALAVLELPKGGTSVTLAASVSLRRAPRGPLSVLALRDAHERLICSVYIDGESRRLMLYNPPGGISAESFVVSLRTRVPVDGPPLALRIDLRRDVSTTAAVDGKTVLEMPGPGYAKPSGATAGPARSVEAGVLSYESNRLHDPAEVALSGVRADPSGP